MAQKKQKKVKRHDAGLWWWLTVRGIAAILFGIMAVFWPGLTLATLIVLFAVFALVTGVISLATGFLSVGRGGYVWLRDLLVGLIEVGIGVYLLRHPGIAVGVFIVLLAVVLIARGIIEGVSLFIEQRATSVEKTLTAIGAVLAIVVGVVILLYPVGTSVTFVWLIGLFALIQGPLLIALSADLRKTFQA